MRTFATENEDGICEYFGCSQVASEEIYAQIGEGEKISLNLCKECADKIRHSLESRGEVLL
jgi:protein-arginine kinase activator protein McsA